MWPCVITIASVDAGGTGSGTWLSACVACVPCNSPQSTYTCLPLASVRRCLLPVTVPAAPTNVSSATGFLRDDFGVRDLRRHRDAARARLALIARQTRVDEPFGIGVFDQRGARGLLHELRDAREIVRDAAGVAQHADQLALVVRDAELAQRAAAPADEQHEVGAVDVVRLAAHQPRAGEHDRRIRVERRLEHVDVLFARARRRHAEALAAAVVRAEHRGMRQSRARAGYDHAAELGDAPAEP